MIFSPHDSPFILVFTADARFVGGSHPSCLLYVVGGQCTVVHVLFDVFHKIMQSIFAWTQFLMQCTASCVAEPVTISHLSCCVLLFLGCSNYSGYCCAVSFYAYWMTDISRLYSCYFQQCWITLSPLFCCYQLDFDVLLRSHVSDFMCRDSMQLTIHSLLEYMYYCLWR